MRLMFSIVCLIICGAVAGQYKGPKFPINDEWFWKYGSKGLQEGDKMPDIPLGTTINNKTGKKRFSEFKGKLVILDFWSTSCTSCMAKFPEMEQLQKEFGDQIQVILVNQLENENQIKERIRQLGIKNVKFPDLPCIVANRPYMSLKEYFKNPSLIGRYFPIMSVPHHVWVDKDGIIRLRGGSENTYPGNIRDFLSGKSITILKNNSTIPDLRNDPNARYYQQLGYLKNTPVVYGSFITPYNNDITGSYGSFLNETVDSAKGVMITNAINQDLLNLYWECFYREQSIFGRDSKLLFSPSAYNLVDFIEFPKNMDTLILTANPSIIQRPVTTNEIIRSKFCYEQVMPLEVPEAERYKMILEDLNRYCKVHYGITGSVQEKPVKYYELIRTSDKDKVGTESSKYIVDLNQDGDELRLQFQYSLGDLFPTLLRNKNLPTPHFLFDTEGHPFLVLNETGWSDKKHISINISLKSVESISGLRKMLEEYDLDLVEKIGPIPFYVFKRVNGGSE